MKVRISVCNLVLKMFNMENLDLDVVNRQFFFDSSPFINTNSGSSTTGSTNSSDLFLYDENSSDSVTSEFSYNSDQENDAKEYVDLLIFEQFIYFQIEIY